MASQSHINKQVVNLLKEILFELRVLNGADVHEAMIEEVDDALEVVGVEVAPPSDERSAKNAKTSK